MLHQQELQKQFLLEQTQHSAFITGIAYFIIIIYTALLTSVNVRNEPWQLLLIL